MIERVQPGLFDVGQEQRSPWRADANRIGVGEPNVIERVARRTSASVLVVPEGTTHGPDHIVAAVDESRFAPRVLDVASRLARMHEVPLTVLHVLSPVEGAYERVIRSAKHLLTRAGGPRLDVTRALDDEVARTTWSCTQRHRPRFDRDRDGRPGSRDREDGHAT